MRQWIGALGAAWLVMAMAASAMAQDMPDHDGEPPVDLPALQDDAEGALFSQMDTPPAAPLFNLREGDTVPVICPFKGDIDYEPGEISCGLVAVRENREAEESRLIQLLYVRLHARGEDEEARREDPVVYLTGGPGVGAAAYVERFVDHEIIQTRDLYILQQRGIGHSGGFCPLFDLEEPALNVGRTLAEQEEFARRRLERCFDRALAEGVDLAAYNTVENARDVRVLREALGFEQWNVWGISYGSHLGQMLTRVDPEGIRALVIDAIVPNDLENLMRIHRWAGRVLDHIVRTCDADPACARTYPDLEARTFAAMAALQENPVTVTVSDTETFPGGEVVMGGQAIAFAPFMMMYEQETYPGLAAVLNALVRAAERRDETVFTALALAAGGMAGGDYSEGMSSAVRCNDGYTWHNAQVIAEDMAEVPALAGLVGTVEGAAADQALCERYGMTLRDRSDYGPVSFDGPALIVNGAWDPITPTDLARQIMPGFANGQYLEVPFAGHGPTRSDECTARVMIAFFDDPAGELDASCVETANMEPAFVTPLTSRLAARALVGWEEDRGGLLALLGWGALSAMVLGLALLVFPIAFMLRRIDRMPAANTGGARAVCVAAAALGAGGMIVLGYAAYVTSEISPILLIAGLAGPARIGAWMVLLGGLAGIAALFLVVGARLSSGKMAFGALAGIVVTSLAAVSLAVFAAMADLTPF
ncbi:MAG: alpha/beta fold hydrolase [Oceanicaulis sp.]|uniref:alpha/beta fold hydrolase n=1 Tax=Glycocaulis sp. TaxID=1969725 RepID=UPI0025BE300F|nr:alpha/beta fold hydrolase [Glycocaulis sp.]MCC5981947.1 alpha/beta fold hydrolase [Oceanicaulis sp.]MCH8521192.1 alpha/beta hydrolase [Glycocaulis sp.]